MTTVSTAESAWTPGRSVDERLRAAGLPPLSRTAWLEIDAGALLANLTSIRELAGAAVEVAPVVKADAYGHGLEGVLDAIGTPAGTRLVCVATLDEALAVRAASPSLRILVLYPVPVSAVAEAVEARLELVASGEADTMRLLEAWRQVGEAHHDRRLPLHLEVETGLQRGGVAPDRVAILARAIGITHRAVLASLWSHLARPDDRQATDAQVGRFEAASAELRGAGVSLPPRHLGATGGVFAATAPAYDMVRPGLALYGELPDDIAALAGAARAGSLRPAMTLKTRPVRIAEVPAGTPVGYGGRWVAERPSVIATLPLGYGDGWARASSPGSRALVRGRSVDLVGSVAMDALAADVTDVPGVSETDEFVLLGAQGGERITAGELARRRTTISWEVLTGMAQRLPRVYHRGSDIVALQTSGARTVHRSRGHAS